MQGEFIKAEQIKTLGRYALLLEWRQEIKPEILYSILAVRHHLEQNHIDGLIESVMGYASLTLFFNLTAPDKNRIWNIVENCPESLSKELKKSAKTVEIPVCYDDIFALDREIAESTTGIKFDEIIQIHSQRDYLLYFTGFMPGFMYLGGLDPRLQMPRKATPRLEVADGSVGIAGMQTGIYPFKSPGGWQIIGRCPVRLFDPIHPPHCPAKPGDTVRFRQISLAEFLKI